MSDKVKLPKEVVEAIERTKSKHYTWKDHDLCYIVLNQLGYCQYENDADIKLIHRWSNTNELIFAKALINGYEVEQTPEDIVRLSYEACQEQINRLTGMSDAEYWKGVNEGVRTTLGTLNIKIPGINT